MDTRVFVRLYDGRKQQESEDEVLSLPPPPLTWSGVVSAMISAVTKQPDAPEDAAVAMARVFLLPTEPNGLAAELNARSLRFGIRENDRFVISLNGEDYSPPSSAEDATETEANAISPAVAKAPAVTTELPPIITVQPPQFDARPVPRGPPSGNIGGGAPPGGLMGMSKGTKRYRSISGKMAAIKALGDKGLISAEDRGHLKDLLLNNDSPALQDALDRYNSTGDFQAVKDLLSQELQHPSVKRNAGEWLSESLINDISLNFQTTDSSEYPADNQRTSGYSSSSPAAQPQNPFMYHAQSPGYSRAGYQESYTNSTTSSPVYQSNNSPVAPTSEPMTSYQQQAMQWVQEDNMHSSGYEPPMSSLHHASEAPGSGYSHMQRHAPMRRPGGYDSSSTMPGLSEIGYAHHNGYAAPPILPDQYGDHGVGMYPNEMMPPAASHEYGRMGVMGSYGMVHDMPHGGPAYGAPSMLHHQQHQFSTGGYPAPGYGSMMNSNGYDYYSPGYAFGKSQLRNGGKWTTAPPMPSYPPPCSKEEKKEKIEKWLKKRENRNWSNKPSYPVRHSIAKNRKRGEDGRFITKARLAEMAEEQAAAAAAEGNGSSVPSNERSLGLENEMQFLPNAATLPAC